MVEFVDRSASIFVVTIVFLGLSFIAVCLRCFVRLRLVKAFGWDDALMVFAMCLNILFALCGIIGSVYGMGRKFEHILPDLDQLKTALFWWWLGQISYVLTCVVAKISIALALLRLTVTKMHTVLLWIVVGMSLIVGLVFFFVLTLECKPVSYFWTRFTTEGTCLSTDTIINIAYLYSVTATLCDFILGLLPISLVWNLQMNRKSKVALAGILSMGCVASAAVIVRIPYLPSYKEKEFLYATTDISIWSNVEASLGIMAGSLVTLRPLFRWFRGASYYGGGKSARRAYGSMPLSSMNGQGNGTHQSRSDRGPAPYWRPDVYPQDSHAMVTTVQTSRGSTNSSQEDLNPKQGSLHGVNVHKSFLVTSDEV